jgi:hypothetical protein
VHHFFHHGVHILKSILMTETNEDEHPLADPAYDLAIDKNTCFQHPLHYCPHGLLLKT